MPGKYLKRAAQACSGKARFASAEEAMRHAEGRLQSYRCAVCGEWHLTSRGSPSQTSTKEAPESPWAKLKDLTWPDLPVPEPPRPEDLPTHAVCRGRYDREGRILLEIESDRVRSLTVPSVERERYGDGVAVRIAWRNGRPFIVALTVA